MEGLLGKWSVEFTPRGKVLMLSEIRSNGECHGGVARGLVKHVLKHEIHFNLCCSSTIAAHVIYFQSFNLPG